MSEPREFSEEELAQIEAEMQRISVDDVLLQTLVTLLNLAARKAGLAAPPGQDAPPADLEQMGQAIEGARALLPLVETRHAEQLGPVRDTLSQLQMAYSQLSQAGGAVGAEPGKPEPAAGEPKEPKEPKEGGEGEQGGRGPAQSSGRLWVPGQ